MTDQTRQSTAFRSYWQLGWWAQVQIIWTVFKLQAQLIFSQRFFGFLSGILLYLTLLYIINYQSPVYDRFDLEDLYIGVLTMPLMALALYLNMQVIVSEKEKNTLEVMFTTAGSRYKVWLIRLGSLNALIFLLTLSMSLVAFFTFADFSILSMTCSIFVTVFFVGNLTQYFAVRLRSGLGAGMVTGLALILIMMMSGILELDRTRYFLFFNPYNIPDQMDPRIWEAWMWQNRIGVFIIGVLLLFFSLRGMDNRDRLLR